MGGRLAPARLQRAGCDEFNYSTIQWNAQADRLSVSKSDERHGILVGEKAAISRSAAAVLLVAWIWFNMGCQCWYVGDQNAYQRLLALGSEYKTE
jgi:hypothetical protein